MENKLQITKYDEVSDLFSSVQISDHHESKSNFMTVKNDSVLTKLKDQCFERLKSKRRSMLDERRKQNVLRESKKHRGLNEEIQNDQVFLGEMVSKEILKMQLQYENTADKEIENMKIELEQFCHQQLQNESIWDQEYQLSKEESQLSKEDSLFH